MNSVGPGGRRQAHCPVVAQRDARAAGHPRHGQRGPADHRRQRVGLHPGQDGARPAAPGCDEEPGRAGARVHHAGWRERACRPAHHRVHHRPRREHLARRAPLRGRANPAELFSQRILASQDLGADGADLAGVAAGSRRPGPGGLREALLGRGPAGHLARAQPGGQDSQLLLRPGDDHAAHCEVRHAPGRAPRSREPVHKRYSGNSQDARVEGKPDRNQVLARQTDPDRGLRASIR